MRITNGEQFFAGTLVSSKGSQLILEGIVNGKEELHGFDFKDWYPEKIAASEVVWNNMDFRVTKHFTVGEYLRYDPRRIPQNGSVKQNALNILTQLEIVRTVFGEPISITSGYRPSPVNKAVGGASQSMHLVGCAVDITAANIDDLFNLLKDNWNGRLGDARAYKRFIHLDLKVGTGFVPNSKPIIFPY